MEQVLDFLKGVDWTLAMMGFMLGLLLAKSQLAARDIKFLTKKDIGLVQEVTKFADKQNATNEELAERVVKQAEVSIRLAERVEDLEERVKPKRDSKGRFV